MASWPATLPQQVLRDGLGETLPDTALRTSMDVGPAKLRRRSSAAVRPISAAVNLSTSQAADLETFYVSTLEGGTLPFDMADPRTGTTYSFRFTSPPGLSPLGATIWRASLALERLP